MNKVRTIILMIVGVLFLVWGVNTTKLSKNGPGDVTVISGRLNCIEGACDQEFGIAVDSPVLVRNVRMYQADIDSNGKLTYDFYNSRIDITPSELEKYNKAHPLNRVEPNPQFPDDVGSGSVFIGKVTLGDNSDIMLDERILEKLMYQSYIYFDHQPAKMVVSGLQEMSPVGRYQPLSDTSFGVGNEKDWQVGDVLISWSCVDPADLAQTYTAVGKLSEDGLLGADTDYIVEMFDKEMTEEEVIAHFSSSNGKAAIFMFVVAFVLIGVSVLLLAAEIRENKNSTMKKKK